MSRFTRSVLMAVLAGSFALATGAPAAAARAAHTGIASHQYFTATINGLTGETQPVSIRMACFGPAQPGKTGHPFKGQTVAVKQVLVPSGGTSALGYTGDRGTSIGAFFGAPPPGAASSASYVRFTSYGQKAIPTSLVLPCSGSGQVTFVALPLDPTSHSVAVPVSFVPQP